MRAGSRRPAGRTTPERPIGQGTGDCSFPPQRLPSPLVVPCAINGRRHPGKPLALHPFALWIRARTTTLRCVSVQRLRHDPKHIRYPFTNDPPSLHGLVRALSFHALAPSRTFRRLPPRGNGGGCLGTSYACHRCHKKSPCRARLWVHVKGEGISRQDPPSCTDGIRLWSPRVDGRATCGREGRRAEGRGAKRKKAAARRLRPARPSMDHSGQMERVVQFKP